MHASPQPDPQRPQHGQPQYGRPSYGQPRPSAGYGPSGPAVPPPPPPPTTFDPDALPGAAVAVRVLMFIGGVVGLLIGAFLCLVAVLGFGADQLSPPTPAGESHETEGFLTLLSALAGILALVPLGYGIVSTLLASSMGRRSKVLFWGIIAFHTVASLLLLVPIVNGDVLSYVPLAVALLMIGLMLPSRVRAFYRV